MRLRTYVPLKDILRKSGLLTTHGSSAPAPNRSTPCPTEAPASDGHDGSKDRILYKRRKIVVVVAAGIVFLMCLMPPWTGKWGPTTVPLGYRFILDPPERDDPGTLGGPKESVKAERPVPRLTKQQEEVWNKALARWRAKNPAKAAQRDQQEVSKQAVQEHRRFKRYLSYRIDTQRLAVQIFAVAVVAGTAVWLLKTPSRPKHDEGE